MSSAQTPPSRSAVHDLHGYSVWLQPWRLAVLILGRMLQTWVVCEEPLPRSLGWHDGMVLALRASRARCGVTRGASLGQSSTYEPVTACAAVRP